MINHMTIHPGGNSVEPVGSPCPRPVRTLEEQRFQQLMQEHHYLGALPKISETLWYVATFADQWVALVSFSAPALKCSPRDRWIGWDFRHQYDRLKLVTNNRRFLKDESLAIDGKTMCNAIDDQGYQTHIMSAIGHQSKACYTQKKSTPYHFTVKNNQPALFTSNRKSNPRPSILLSYQLAASRISDFATG